MAKPVDTADTTFTLSPEVTEPLLINNGTHYLWPKGFHVSLSKNFSTSEFECPIAEYQTISVELVNTLQRVRDAYGDSIVVTSGYRSQEHQDALAARGYKTAKNSQHVLGNAVDITARDMNRLLDCCQQEFKAIGIANNFLHVDTRRDKTRRWSY